MSHLDPQMLDALEALPTDSWEGDAWRHMFNDYPPNRVNLSGARWNPQGVGAIYAAMDRKTALAEGQHAIDIQPRRIFRQRVLYRVQLHISDLADLTGEGALKSLGLKISDIESNDFTACQEVGKGAAWLGLGGLLVPSAPHTGSNLVVLVGDLDTDDYLEEIEREVIYPDPPEDASGDPS